MARSSGSRLERLFEFIVICDILAFAETGTNYVLCLSCENRKTRFMPHRVAERLTELALKCSRLSRKYRGHEVAAELETLAADLAEEASRLDRLFNVIEE
ncbi:MAG: hypothetical protein WAK63_12085 [Xanthobacteraceae bacterium]